MVPSSLWAGGGNAAHMTFSRGPLRTVPFLRALSSERGAAPAPRARQRPLRRRGLSLAILLPGLAPRRRLLSQGPLC